MPLVTNYRGTWDVDQKVGSVELALQGAPAAMLAPLDAANFSAVLAILGSDKNILYDPGNKRLISPN